MVLALRLRTLRVSYRRAAPTARRMLRQSLAHAHSPATAREERRSREWHKASCHGVGYPPRATAKRRAAALVARAPPGARAAGTAAGAWEPTRSQAFRASQQFSLHQNCRRRREKDVRIKPCKISAYSWYALTLWWALRLACPLGHQQQSCIGPS